MEGGYESRRVGYESWRVGYESVGEVRVLEGGV